MKYTDYKPIFMTILFIVSMAISSFVSKYILIALVIIGAGCVWFIERQSSLERKWAKHKNGYKDQPIFVITQIDSNGTMTEGRDFYKYIVYLKINFNDKEIIRLKNGGWIIDEDKYVFEKRQDGQWYLKS